MKLELTLKHGEPGKQDVRIRLSDTELLITEPMPLEDYREDVVCLDRFQIRALAKALKFWCESDF